MDFLDNIQNKLPQHSVNSALWDKVELRLDEGEQLPLNLLPEHSVSEGLFDSIQLKLEERKTRRLNGWMQLYRATAVAASLALVLYLTVLKSNPEIRETQIVISEEVIEYTIEDVEANSNNSEIQRFCSISPEVCETSEFSQLKTKWDRLTNEVNKLRLINQNQSNTRLVHYIKRVEKDIFEVERQMTQLF